MVKYARIMITHVCFIELTLGLVFKQLSRDLANVNAWKTCVIPIVVYRFYCMALFYSQTRRHVINRQIKIKIRYSHWPFMIGACAYYTDSSEPSYIANRKYASRSRPWPNNEPLVPLNSDVFISIRASTHEKITCLGLRPGRTVVPKPACLATESTLKICS